MPFCQQIGMDKQTGIAGCFKVVLPTWAPPLLEGASGGG